MAERDRAAVRVHMLRIVGEAQARACTASAWLGERLVELDGVDLGELEAEPLRELMRSRAPGPMPMMRGSTPAAAMPRRAPSG